MQFPSSLIKDLTTKMYVIVEIFQVTDKILKSPVEQVAGWATGLESAENR
jgi:hypothetical protein